MESASIPPEDRQIFNKEEEDIIKDQGSHKKVLIHQVKIYQDTE